VKRITLVTTVFGGILLAVGLLFVGSSLAKGEQDSRTAGMLMMSFAGMMVAVPLYIEARRLQAEHRAMVVQKGKARAAQRCSGCGMETAAFWCTTHTVRLCSECVPKHDEPSRCLYKSLVTVAQKSAAAGGR
jgi:hypothetical protein